MTEQMPDGQTIQRYDDLARLHLELTNTSFASLLEGTTEDVPHEVRSVFQAAQPIKYAPVKTEFGGVLFMAVVTEINTAGHSYVLTGGGGGLGLGFSISWGAAWLNKPIDSMVGWDFRFEMNFGIQVVNVNWWAMNGEPIGSFVGAGVSIGAGIFGGAGKITQKS